MSTSQILPFALGGGANVLTYSDWFARTARLNGFVNGVANPQEANTALRQAAFVAAVLAQMTATESGAQFLDNGDMLTAQANMRNAIAAIALDAVPTYDIERVIAGTVGTGPVLSLNNGAINTATDTTILSVSVTGARWIDVFSSALFYNVTGTPCGAVVYHNLVNSPAPTFGQGNTVITTSAATAIPCSVRTVWTDLNPNTTYTIQFKGLRTVSGVSLTADYPLLVATYGTET